MDAKNVKNIYWVIGILITNTSLKKDAKYVMKKLNEKGIGTRPFFWPMHKQKMLKNFNFYNSNKFTNSEYINKYGLLFITLKTMEVLENVEKVENLKN